MSELKQSDAFIGATLSMMISDQVGDVYRLLDPDVDSRSQEKDICKQIDKWVDQYGNPQSQNAALTLKMFQSAQEFCD